MTVTSEKFNCAGKFWQDSFVRLLRGFVTA